MRNKTNTNQSPTIILENPYAYLHPETISIIKDILRTEKIELVTFEARSATVVQDAFEWIPIVLSDPLVQQVFTGTLAIASYEAIKAALFTIVTGSRSFFHRNRPADTSFCVKISHKKATILAPLPNDMNEEKFSKYMDMVSDAIKETSQLYAKQTKPRDCYIIENKDGVPTIK